MKSSGKWYGDEYYFGMHYDLHAGKKDTRLGTRCSPAELCPMLKLMDPDFVQTDCKGHAGYTSWFSKVKNASVPIGRGSLLKDCRLPHPAAVLNRVGNGQIAYVPADIFRDFANNRYPLTRCFAGELVERLWPEPPIRVKAPTCIDASFRRQSNAVIVHLVNRTSGLPNVPESGAIDEIPPVGPIIITLHLPERPGQVKLAFEDEVHEQEWSDGLLSITVHAVRIHAAVVIEGASALIPQESPMNIPTSSVEEGYQK